ncbi:hydrogenase [Methanobacterium sp. ACI-7]|uniref:hydrogenase n=1 Tax=unclassified Methanobacterium TaxID=2627676 RepID=UPI0039C448CB
MKKEQDMLILMAMVGLGAVIMSGLAVLKQWIIVIPLTIAVIFLAVFLFYQNREKFIHISESLENWAFIAALLLFIVSFIVLYKPA